MLSEKMEKALNKQINAELYSAYLYMSMGAYFDAQNFGGFAKWMMAQGDEEREHAMKIYEYVYERDGRVEFEAIDKPKTDWNGVEDVFSEVLEHERKVTKMIHDLVDLAAEEKDHATSNFLQWFVSEQVEEEASATEILETVQFIGESKNGIYLYNRQLGKREG